MLFDFDGRDVISDGIWCLGKAEGLRERLFGNDIKEEKFRSTCSCREESGVLREERH